MKTFFSQAVTGLASCITISAVVVSATVAHAISVVRIDQSAFNAGAGLITFSEFANGTVNPTYNPGDYGGGAGSPIVQFGGAFFGQTVGQPPFPAGAAPTGVVNGSPTGPLSLNPNSPNTFITVDGSNPTSPVLSGSPLFNGPVSILFNRDVAGVGLDGGFFNAIGGTAITAFSRTGSVLGQVTNQANGIEFLGLVTDNGQEAIAGLQFSLVGAEPFGFAIDNVRFGVAGQVTPPSANIPTPALLPGLIALGMGVLRKRKAEAISDSEA